MHQDANFAELGYRPRDSVLDLHLVRIHRITPRARSKILPRFYLILWPMSAMLLASSASVSGVGPPRSVT